MIRHCFVIFLLVLCSLDIMAKESEYKVDGKNIIFSCIVENIPAKKEDIFEAAQKYLNEAYKDTKYEILHSSPESGFIIGAGQIDSFHEKSGVLDIVSINLEFQVRIDVMDNRSRIQLIASDWNVNKFKDTGGKESLKIKIVEVRPIGDDITDKGMYTKAFEKLQEFASHILTTISEDLQSAKSAPATETDW